MALKADPDRSAKPSTVEPPSAIAEGFRPDVQGLRAIAVTMVVVYHLYPSSLPGGFVGVDVFFVISGFLITSHLARTAQHKGRVRLLEFWGRRARRLLPAAAVVLTATWIVSRLVLPATRLPATAEQIRGSALYYQNWILARDAVDYLTSADSPSPVQHFWSLSVEEQFYLFWPFVFVIAAVFGLRGHRRAARRAAFVLACSIVVASLVYSSHLTGTDPAAAYFVTTTRIWELGLGGLLALLSAPVRNLLARQGWLGWVGLGMVAWSALYLSGASSFPGTVALMPVGGAALLIAAGSRDGRGGPWRLTSLRPMVFVGDISYSLYLWHWPIIVLWKAYSGGGIHYLDGPVIFAVSLVLAWLTKLFVEDTVRRAPLVLRHTGWSLATALTVIVPVGLAAMYSAPAKQSFAINAQHPGGTVKSAQIAKDVRVSSLKPIPSVAQAPLDFEPFSKCETPIPSVTPRPCVYGDTTNPTLTVALIGDSVAGQYKPVLETMAKQRHWKLVTQFHGQCPWTDTVMARQGTSDAYTVCHRWGQQVLTSMLATYKPDVVVTSGRPVLGVPNHPRPDAVSFRAIAAGMVTYWRTLAAQGIKVVPIQESAEPGRNIPDCLSKPNATVGSCTASRSQAVRNDTPILQAAHRFPAAKLVDPNPLICGPTQCLPIVGNVVVYRDTHHMTLTYVRSITARLSALLLGTGAFSKA